MNIIEKLYILFKYRKIGVDLFGNKYFESPKVNNHTKLRKRVIIYNGIIEASKIPAIWHTWLHYYILTPPNHLEEDEKGWYKDKVPNLTGTKLALNVYKKNMKVNTISHYKAWKPSSLKKGLI